MFPTDHLINEGGIHMIEIPESQVLSKQLTQTFSGKSIVDAIAGFSPHGFAGYHGDPGSYREILTDQVWGPAFAQGGQIRITIGDFDLVFSDGARIRYLEPGSAAPAKHQFWAQYDDGSMLYCTVQMYAGIDLYPRDTLDNPYYLAAKELPNPLSDQFDETYFEQLTAKSKQTLSTKAFLATEQRIPGLGNGVLQDILFLAGIHPKRKIQTLTDQEKENLFGSIKQTLAHMTAQGGRDTEKDLYAHAGGYHTVLSKNTWQNPCPHCGGNIVRQTYLGGNIYFCPTCQPVPS